MVLADDLAVIGQKLPQKPDITVDPSPNQRRKLPLVLQKGKWQWIRYAAFMSNVDISYVSTPRQL